MIIKPSNVESISEQRERPGVVRPSKVDICRRHRIARNSRNLGSNRYRILDGKVPQDSFQDDKAVLIESNEIKMEGEIGRSIRYLDLALTRQ
jgi:hypothetical protein